MYNAYFGFKETPFSIAPDPRYLYMTDQHREALAHLVYGLNSEGGCILLTGEVGTGKTTVCRCLLEQIPQQSNIALVFNPKVTATELLETICDELGIEYPEGENSVKTYIDRINDFLLQANAAGQKTVLIIDEAQNLDSTVLEQLRLLTNLETNQRKLLQIIILGQPELLEILSHENMRQLAQRITARFHLNPLTRDELKAYITHRLAIAGSNIQLFDEKTLKRLYQLSKGIPRIINIICDRALLGAYVENKNRIDIVTLNNAAREVFGEASHDNNTKTRWPAMAAAVAGVAAVAMATYLILQSGPELALALHESGDQLQDTVVAENETAADNAVSTLMQAPANDTITPEDDSVATVEQNTETGQAGEIATVNDSDRSSALKELLFTEAESSKIQAYTDLFDVWNKKYDVTRNGNACGFAVDNGLSCLHRQGNLRSLAILNRPAVLKFYDDHNNTAYAIVTYLDTNEATLRRGNSTLTVSVDTLNEYWLGEYTLLWQKPPYYHSAVQPGSQGPIVQWLDQQMVRLYGQNEVPTIRNTYNDELQSQVIKFQQSKGLTPDGVVGPHTFILLNSELELNTPLLNTRKG
ncbi:MAG: AAA family ATPase [Gammaproteobacteria bacterium]|jgi:general secretion pathway protein A